ncbi:MAG: hypothetical protein AAFO84_04865 [Cyanobacteria bacterium J06598_1]
MTLHSAKDPVQKNNGYDRLDDKPIGEGSLSSGLSQKPKAKKRLTVVRVKRSTRRYRRRRFKPRRRGRPRRTVSGGSR